MDSREAILGIREAEKAVPKLCVMPWKYAQWLIVVYTERGRRSTRHSVSVRGHEISMILSTRLDAHFTRLSWLCARAVWCVRGRKCLVGRYETMIDAKLRETFRSSRA